MIPHTLMKPDRVTIIAVGRSNPDAPSFGSATIMLLGRPSARLVWRDDSCRGKPSAFKLGLNWSFKRTPILLDMPDTGV